MTSVVLLTIAAPPVTRGPALAASSEIAAGALRVAPVNWSVDPLIPLEEVPRTANSRCPIPGTVPCAANKTGPLAGMFAVAAADNNPTGPTGVVMVAFALQAPWIAPPVEESGAPLADNSKGPNNPKRPNGVLSDTVACAVPWNPPSARGTFAPPSDNSKGPTGVLTYPRAEPALGIWVADPPADHNPTRPSGVFSATSAFTDCRVPPPARGAVVWLSNNSKGPKLKFLAVWTAAAAELAAATAA